MNNWVAYDEAVNNAWADYFKARNIARKIYEEVKTRAWGTCQEAVKQAREEYLTEEVEDGKDNNS